MSSVILHCESTFKQKVIGMEKVMKTVQNGTWLNYGYIKKNSCNQYKVRILNNKALCHDFFGGISHFFSSP